MMSLEFLSLINILINIYGILKNPSWIHCVVVSFIRHCKQESEIKGWFKQNYFIRWHSSAASLALALSQSLIDWLT